MMTARVTAVGASSVTIKLLGRSGAGIEVPVPAGNVAAAVHVTGPDPQGGTITSTQAALAVGDRVACAELTAEPGSWLILARLG